MRRTSGRTLVTWGSLLKLDQIQACRFVKLRRDPGINDSKSS